MAAGQGMPGPIGPGGHGLGGPGMVGMPGNMQNPLMFLQNQMGAQNHQMGPAQNHQMGPGQNHQMGAAVPPGMLGQSLKLRNLKYFPLKDLMELLKVKNRSSLWTGCALHLINLATVCMKKNNSRNFC